MVDEERRRSKVLSAFLALSSAIERSFLTSKSGSMQHDSGTISEKSENGVVFAPLAFAVS